MRSLRIHKTLIEQLSSWKLFFIQANTFLLQDDGGESTEPEHTENTMYFGQVSRLASQLFWEQIFLTCLKRMGPFRILVYLFKVAFPLFLLNYDLVR